MSRMGGVETREKRGRVVALDRSIHKTVGRLRQACTSLYCSSNYILSEPWVTVSYVLVSAIQRLLHRLLGGELQGESTVPLE